MSGLGSLARLRPGVRRGRASTWDRTGGNADSVFVPAGAQVVVAEDTGPGQITHVWFTLLTPDLWWGRRLVLRAWWDGEDSPSVEVPLGDFFGAGNCVAAPFTSAAVELAPRDAASLHSWFPMPFTDGFRLAVENQGPLPVLALYCYVDYERWPVADRDLGRFHAWWTRDRRVGVGSPPGTYAPGTNLTGEANHLFVATEGRGHLVGTALYVHSEMGGWYGEGDDMFFVDGDTWPPSVHGTGTEDYFGTAWGPSQPFAHPFYGQPVAERDDWAGFSSLYRFHLRDPITFERSLRATIEHGHANDRADDWSSVAYWYQLDRPGPLAPLPAVAERLPPWPEPWRRRADAVHETFGRALSRPDLLGDPDELARWVTAVGHVTRLVQRGDWDGIDDALAWLAGPAGRPPAGPVAREQRARPSTLAPLRGADAASLDAWLARTPPAEVAAAVVDDFVARFDPDAAGGAQLTVGVRVRGDDDGGGLVEHAWQLVVAGGACLARRGSEGHERLTLVGDAATLVRWTLGRLDPWEAILRGGLAVRGDTSLGFRLSALFPQPT